MMKEISIKDLTILDPFSLEINPAIALASDGKETNGLTIGWASFGILWRKPTATVYVHKARYSKHIFDNAQYFSICFMGQENKEAVKYFGTVSGRDENKIKNCNLSLISDDLAPYFKESNLVIICKIMGRNDFDPNSVDKGVFEWYQKDGVHTQYFGEIVKIYQAL